MPRVVFRYRPLSKGAIRVRRHRLLKRLEKEQQQSERLHSEGDASTSYSVGVLPPTSEPVATEEAINNGDQNVPNTEQPQPGGSEEWIDDVQFFRRWVNKYNISGAALGALLFHFRRTHPSLPADPRTLMRTPEITDLREISPAIDSQNPCYIVATLPAFEDSPVLLSSTWMVDEWNYQGLRITQMPSYPPRRFYKSVQEHTPCQPSDKKYAFKEIARTTSFSYARELELRYCNESACSSDDTIHEGLPPRRKIRRNLLPQKDDHTVEEQPDSPAHAEHELPQADTCSMPIQPVSLKPSPRLQSSSAIHTELTQAPCSDNNRPDPSTSDDSSAVRLMGIENMLKEMLPQVKRTALLVAHMSERCTNIEQSLETVYGENNRAGISKSSFPNVPAYTMEQIMALDTQLQEEEFYRRLSDQFLGIPGGDLRTLVRNILMRLISPVISEEIHCTGKQWPFRFKNSRLHGFLLDQVSRRLEFAGVDPKTVACEARLWFRLRREQRRSKTQGVRILPPGIEYDNLLSIKWEESMGDNAELGYAYP